MHKIDGYGATPDSKFTEGSPGPVPVPPTYVTADWMNAVQEEITNVTAAAGIVLDKGNNGQLLQAILAIAAGAAGGIKVVAAADSPYLVQPIDSVILADCTAGDVTIIFPSAAAGSSRRLTCKKVDATGNAAKYSPLATQTVESEAVSYDSIMPGEFMSFVPDGVAAWHRVG